MKPFHYLELNIILVLMKLWIVLNILSIFLYSKSKLEFFNSSLLSNFDSLAEKHGLKKVDRQKFKDYFNDNKDTKEGRSLLAKMKALEVTVIYY
jgi:hypothetical protein